jgi:site-specific DNA-methyltransferase (adenine-specific)
MRKAWESAQTTAEVVVCLVPNRSGTVWWREWARRGEIEEIPGRLKFDGAKDCAPFYSAVVVFRGAGKRHETSLNGVGVAGGDAEQVVD